MRFGRFKIPVEAARCRYLKHTLLQPRATKSGDTVFAWFSAVHEIGHCGSASFPVITPCYYFVIGKTLYGPKIAIQVI